MIEFHLFFPMRSETRTFTQKENANIPANRAVIRIIFHTATCAPCADCTISIRRNTSANRTLTHSVKIYKLSPTAPQYHRHHSLRLWFSGRQSDFPLFNLLKLHGKCLLCCPSFGLIAAWACVLFKYLIAHYVNHPYDKNC